MKKLALFMAIVMSLLVFSFVFASEEDILLIAPAPVEEIEEQNDIATGAEEIPTAIEEGESIDITSNPEVISTEDTSKDPEVISTEETSEDPVVISEETTETKSNSTIVGAIIAIVIVVVVVALAALVQKK